MRNGKNLLASSGLLVSLRSGYQLVERFTKKHRFFAKYLALFFIFLIIFSQIDQVAKPKSESERYNLASYSQLLEKPVKLNEEKLKLDRKTGIYNYNEGYVPSTEVAGNVSGPKITASFEPSPSGIVKIEDPQNNIGLQLRPKFKIGPALKVDNRVVYTIDHPDSLVVYTASTSGIKEDILLPRFAGDTLSFAYELTLPDGLEARLGAGGAIGVYGTDLRLLGNVTTGSDADAILLQKARTKAKKNNLLFTLPAPFVKETNKSVSGAKAWFELDGKTLVVKAKDLNKASYPLSIDPSVYAESAANFMRGNNESNIDFDVTNSLIEKGVMTGARFETLTSTTALTAARWNAATVVAGGYIYVIGGSSGTTNFGNVYWAKLNTSTYTIDSPNPGNGACTNWCTNSAYDLPSSQVRRALSAVAYNGYLYAIGGKDAGCVGTNNACSTVYKARIGLNGEPISWAATSSLSTARSFAGAVAYNNRIYVAGGQTNSTLFGDSGVEFANVNPDGSLSSWSTTGMQTLPLVGGAGRWGHTLLQYNGYIYLVGGASGAAGTTLQTSVQYSKINSDGTMAAWVTNPNSFTTARASFGGNFATVSGGYMYIDGGCSALTTTNCTTLVNTSAAQLASINADGSISDWTAFTLTGTNATLTGQGLVAWRNAVYSVGGCNAATSSSNCTGTLTTTTYGTIKTDGDVSPKATETSLPTIGNANGQVGGIHAVVVVNDGYIYNVGGCITTNPCGSSSDNAGYAPINADGTIGTWSVSNGVLNGATGLSAGSGVVYNNYIYFIGGTDGNGNWTRSVWRASINVTTNHSVNTFTQQTNILNNTYGMSHSVARSIGGTSGNLYIVGGCFSAGTGIGCGANYSTDTMKCTISHTDGSLSSCSTASQLQLQDLDASTAGSQGLGAGAIAVWGDYIYIAGGVCGLSTTSGATAEANGCDGTSTSTVNTSEVSKVYFAKINSSGNVVRADNGNATGGWQIAANKMPIPRRRGVAFAVNGYLYEAGGHDGTTGGVGTLSDIVYSKINPITGDLGVFSSVSQGGSTSNIITARWGHGYVAANGYLYFVGGCISGAPSACSTGSSNITTNIESVQVYNNYSGSPYAYNATGLINTDRYGASTAVYNGYIYTAGGCSGTVDCEASPATGTFLGDSQYAALAADGTIGSWTAGTSFPSSALRTFGCMAAVGGYLYYLGGRDSVDTAGNRAYGTVYYSQITAGTGAPGAWTAATKGIGDTGSGSQKRWAPGCAVNNNKIYVSGGADGSTTYQTTVYVSPSLSSGGDISSNWTSTTAFTGARSGHTLIAYGNTLYLLGGFDGTNYLNDTQYANIDSSGAVGTWGTGSTLPGGVRQASGFAANGYIYLFGGRSASTTCSANTYVTSIAGYAAGSNSRYGIGAWSQTNVKYTGTRYGLAASYYEGKAYLVGGICNATLTGANRTVYSTLQAQPQKSVFSLQIDTDSNVFPTKWLLNGVDNGIGAKWQLSYRSSTTANNTWGQNTTVGDVTLGTAGTYTPLDGSGTDTNTTVGAQYFYLFITVDASQAFGYPEDVSRGPTLADLSLFFTSDPSKRLRHGKTFTGGEQQPLDTPFP